MLTENISVSKINKCLFNSFDEEQDPYLNDNEILKKELKLYTDSHI